MRVADLVESKAMSPSPSPKVPFGIFFVVFLLVFTLVAAAGMVITSILPKAYLGTARLRLEYKDGQSARSERRAYDPVLAKTEAGMINSELILKRVISGLNLNETWGKKYFNGETLKSWECLNILKSRIEVHPIVNTPFIQIRTFDDNPADAAKLANAIVTTYADYAATNADEPQVLIVDSAYASPVPVRPNKVLNIALGFGAGIFLGLLAGTGAALFVYLKARKAALVATV